MRKKQFYVALNATQLIDFATNPITELQHNKNPKNFGKIENACCHFDGQNKMCGDYLSIYISFQGEGQVSKEIADISFECEGCAILKASASMMTEHLKGKSILESKYIFQDFLKLLSKDLEYSEKLDQLNIFSGIASFQSRMQCAMLPWDTLFKGLGVNS